MHRCCRSSRFDALDRRCVKQSPALVWLWDRALRSVRASSVSAIAAIIWSARRITSGQLRSVVHPLIALSAPPVHLHGLWRFVALHQPHVHRKFGQDWEGNTVGICIFFSFRRCDKRCFDELCLPSGARLSGGLDQAAP